MPINGPWYLSARAVREYWRLTTSSSGDPDDDEFDAAAQALAQEIKAAHLVRHQRNGQDLYRLQGKPRLRLLVDPRPHREGPLPALVRVLPEHD